MRHTFQTQRKLPGLPRRETFEEFERYSYHLANDQRFYSVLDDRGLVVVLKLIVLEYFWLLDEGGSQPTISPILESIDRRIGNGDVDLWKLYELQFDLSWQRWRTHVDATPRGSSSLLRRIRRAQRVPPWRASRRLGQARTASLVSTARLSQKGRLAARRSR